MSTEIEPSKYSNRLAEKGPITTLETYSDVFKSPPSRTDSGGE